MISDSLDLSFAVYKGKSSTNAWLLLAILHATLHSRNIRFYRNPLLYLCLRQPFFHGVDNGLMFRETAIAIHGMNQIAIDHHIKGAIVPRD